MKLKKPVIEIENRNTVTIKDFSVEDFKIKVPIENGKIEIIGMEYTDRVRSITRKKVFGSSC